VSPPAEKGKGKKAEPDPPCFPAFLAAAREPLFMLFQKGFPALLWSFEGLFCNFQIV
jgi:hypothetical protein